MHLVDAKEAVRIGSHDELLDYFESAGKPASEWRTGTEHELVGVWPESGAAPTYEGPRGIGALFQWFARRGGTPVLEGDHMIALSGCPRACARSGAATTSRGCPSSATT